MSEHPVPVDDDVDDSTAVLPVVGRPAAAAAVHHHTEPESAADGPPPVVTIVLPCYNEQEHVIAEVERITAAMDASGYTYELLAIDDKSTDDTLAVLLEAAAAVPGMRIMPFRRNGGSGHGAPDRHPRGARRDRRLDRRRHDLPERADPRVRLDPAGRPDVDQVVGARTSEEGTHKFLRVPAKWVIRKIAERLPAPRSRT